MVGAFLIFFLVLSVSGAWAQAAEKIRISVSGSYNMIFLSAGVAQKKGFFQEEGLDVDVVVMRAATSIAALSMWQRVALFIAAILLIAPELISSIVGLVLLATVAVNQGLLTRIKITTSGFATK